MKEIWKAIPKFETYYVSNLGRVRGPNGIKQQHLSRGYCRVSFYRRGRPHFRLVHLLVAAAFIGRCPRHKLTNHKDGNKANPRLDNLEYITPKANTRHAMAAGLISHLQGSAKRNAKLHEDDIPKIFQAVAEGVSRRKVAATFHISRTVLDLIILRKKWRHVVIASAIVRLAQRADHANQGGGNGMATLTAADIIPIFVAAKAGDTLDVIANRFAVSRPTISLILHRKTWSHVAIPKRLQPIIKPSGRLAWN